MHLCSTLQHIYIQLPLTERENDWLLLERGEPQIALAEGGQNDQYMRHPGM